MKTPGVNDIFEASFLPFEITTPMLYWLLGALVCLLLFIVFWLYLQRSDTHEATSNVTKESFDNPKQKFLGYLDRFSVDDPQFAKHAWDILRILLQDLGYISHAETMTISEILEKSDKAIPKKCLASIERLKYARKDGDIHAANMELKNSLVISIRDL